MASCNVSSCSTAFRLWGGVILNGSKGFPLLKCLHWSITTATNTKIDGNIYLIQPLYNKINITLLLAIQAKAKEEMGIEG